MNYLPGDAAGRGQYTYYVVCIHVRETRCPEAIRMLRGTDTTATAGNLRYLLVVVYLYGVWMLLLAFLTVYFALYAKVVILLLIV